MKALLCLAFLVFLYYKLYQWYPLTTKNHVYFGGFIGFCLLIYYLMNYQRPFMMKMASNVHNANRIQLHELIPDYTKQSTSDIKVTLADKQLLRCPGCLNPIDLSYLDHYKLSYTIPLQQGGLNDPSNLSLHCTRCYQAMNSQQ